jgi:hypothetical protein
MNTKEINSVWKHALNVLRNAKHIVIVGYSLPRTDVYMQYFMKAAVGPNRNLQRITVFNPTLFKGDKSAEEMEERYRECFSGKFGKYINFRPELVTSVQPDNRGSFLHFLAYLARDNVLEEKLLFYP